MYINMCVWGGGGHTEEESGLGLHQKLTQGRGSGDRQKHNQSRRKPEPLTYRLVCGVWQVFGKRDSLFASSLPW